MPKSRPTGGGRFGSLRLYPDELILLKKIFNVTYEELLS